MAARVRKGLHQEQPYYATSTLTLAFPSSSRVLLELFYGVVSIVHLALGPSCYME
ncbi:unnamed protein product [Amoebophrya sp. A25]|nr:unnamed protein product [Amoebophrya sp. A25]|eukprot:GSA25T00019827001.1